MMKMNHTSWVRMYNHVQLTVTHACQPFTSVAALMPVVVAQMMNPQSTAEAMPELTQFMRSICDGRTDGASQSRVVMI